MTKKILSLIIATVMLLGMVACSNTNEPATTDGNSTITTNPATNPTNNTENNETADDPTIETTEPQETGFSWQTKSMSQPSVAEPTTKQVSLTATDGEVITSVLINPNVQYEFSDTITAKLKSYPLLKDWVFADGVEEGGAPVLYKNLDGLKYTYDYTESIFAKRPEDADDISAYPDFRLYRQWDTAKSTSFNRISLSIEIKNDELNNDSQKQICNMLCDVFGKEIGEYLCYASTDDKYNISTIQYDTTAISFGRTVDYNVDLNLCSLSFSVSIINNNATYDSICCEEYSPITDFTNLNNVLGDKFAFNPAKYDRYGEAVLETHFKDYLGVETDTNGLNGYTYEYIKYENGYEEEVYGLSGDLRQYDVVKKFAPEFDVSITTVRKDGQLLHTKGDIDMSTGASTEDDKEKLHQEFDSHALAILEELMAGDQNIKADFPINSGGYNDQYMANINIFGKDIEAKFTYRISAELGGHQGLINVSWYADIE